MNNEFDAFGLPITEYGTPNTVLRFTGFSSKEFDAHSTPFGNVIQIRPQWLLCVALSSAFLVLAGCNSVSATKAERHGCIRRPETFAARSFYAECNKLDLSFCIYSNRFDMAPVTNLYDGLYVAVLRFLDGGDARLRETNGFFFINTNTMTYASNSLRNWMNDFGRVNSAEGAYNRYKMQDDGSVTEKSDPQAGQSQVVHKIAYMRIDFGTIKAANNSQYVAQSNEMAATHVVLVNGVASGFEYGFVCGMVSNRWAVRDVRVLSAF